MAAALASPSRIAPSSQSMDASTLSPPPDSAVGDQSNRFYGSPSSSRNSDSLSSSSLRSEEYRQLFRLPAEEMLVQDFNCALQENILLQGHMYLFDHYICFYSNIFGFETKKIIPFQDVTAVRRAKTAGIFPNAIEIVAAAKKHFFASFLSRDEAFKLIFDGWSQNGNGPKGFLDQQDSKSELSFHGVSSVENGNSSDSPVSDCDSDERNLEVSKSGDTNSSPNHVDDDARPSSPENPDIVEEKRDAPAGVASTSSSSASWKEETNDAPIIPKSYSKVGESKFSIKVEQFFKYFFSDDALGFVESYHKGCGDKDFKCTSWTSREDTGCIRQKSFQHPIKVYFGARCGGCKETQKYRVHKNSHLVIETSQEVSDVPYADYFTVEGIWDVERDDNDPEGCILQVYVSVAFSKKTIWKGKIEQSTMEECREAYATWINLAHKLLKEKNIEKTEGNLVGGDQIDQKNSSGENRDHAQSSHVNAESGIITETVTNTLGNHEQSGNILQGSLLHATTITSTVRAFAAKFCSFLKSRGNLQQFLVITLSIILLLMQLSIVVLLSRPQQVYVIPQADHFTSVGLGSGQRAAEAVAWMEKRVHLLKDEMLVVEGQLERMSIVVLLSRPQQVYVIPQADHFTSVGLGSGQRAAEAVAWMEKRVHLLKDEMLVVEGQLERMRHEHISLKAQLKDLERLTQQQR